MWAPGRHAAGSERVTQKPGVSSTGGAGRHSRGARLGLHSRRWGSLEAGQLQVHAAFDPVQQFFQQPVGRPLTSPGLGWGGGGDSRTCEAPTLPGSFSP